MCLSKTIPGALSKWDGERDSREERPPAARDLKPNQKEKP